MKIIYNDYIPFEGFKAMNLFGILFVRSKFKGKMKEVDINHESIHTEQLKDLLYIFYYPVYVLEWLIRVLFTKDFFSHQAYRHISFEQEAYNNEKNLDYIPTRKKFAMWRKN